MCPLCLSEDELASSEAAEDNTFLPQAPPTAKQLVQYMSEPDHDEIQRLRNYAPALIGNPHQIFGYTSSDKKTQKRIRLEQERLAILSRMRRGRSDLNTYYDSTMTLYIGQREIARSIEGYERQSVNSTQQISYNLSQVPKRGAIDRILLRLGAKRE